MELAAVKICALLSGSALAALAAVGCDSPTRPSQPIGEFHLEVYTQEGDATRHLMLVGDHGIARVHAWARPHRCDVSPYEYECGGALDADFRSSDPSVVAPASQAIHGFAEFTLVANRTGSTVLTAETGNRTDSARVDVVSVPLPVDSVRVRLMPYGNESVLDTSVDAAGNVDSLTIPVDEYQVATLRILSFRGGDSTVYLPVTAHASNPDVVSWTFYCASLGCEVDRLGELWVGGRAPGTAAMTVEARGEQYAFQVRVVEK